MHLKSQHLFLHVPISFPPHKLLRLTITSIFVEHTKLFLFGTVYVSKSSPAYVNT